MSTVIGVPRLELAPQRAEVRALEGWFGGLFEPAESALRFRLEVAVHELCLNAVAHAHLAPAQRITLDGERTAAAITVRVRDGGDPVPSAVVDAALGGAQITADRPGGGYGLLIIARLLDGLEHERQAGVTCWTARVRRSGSGADA